MIKRGVVISFLELGGCGILWDWQIMLPYSLIPKLIAVLKDFAISLAALDKYIQDNHGVHF